MVRLLAVLVLAGASVNAQTITTETFGSGANQFQVEFVTIGNPGNVADTTGAPNPVGRVDYVYNLGKHEISRSMITKANLAGGLGITLSDMTEFVGGNSASHSATGISWNEAARFVNWLNTSQGFQAAYKFTTSGANDNISLWGEGEYSGSNPYRHKNAYYFLPSVDEWYKGAYGSPDGTWFDFPNGSDSAPAGVSGGTSGAVYMQSYWQGPAAFNNAGGLSPYGTMGQGGNVFEWTESAYDGSNDSASEFRELRGGSWYTPFGSNDLSVSVRSPGHPAGDDDAFLGFRVASVPEPSSLSLLLAGGAVFAAVRRRRLV